MEIRLDREEMEQAVVQYVTRLVSDRYVVKDVRNLPYGEVEIDLEIPEKNVKAVWTEQDEALVEAIGREPRQPDDEWSEINETAAKAVGLESTE